MSKRKPGVRAITFGYDEVYVRRNGQKLSHGGAAKARRKIGQRRVKGIRLDDAFNQLGIVRAAYNDA
jgi:hypothetical protein